MDKLKWTELNSVQSSQRGEERHMISVCDIRAGGVMGMRGKSSGAR